jgi:Cupin-like domain
VSHVVEGEKSSGANSLPDHFSTVSLPIDDDTDPRKLFSGFRNGAVDNIGCLVVSLSAGEMLYLPASWFHEVN